MPKTGGRSSTPISFVRGPSVGANRGVFVLRSTQVTIFILIQSTYQPGLSFTVFTSSLYNVRIPNSLSDMSDQEFSLSEVRPLLSEDAFQNEQSRRLFEAIDELRSCGANHEIELPEVSRSHA